MRRAPVRAAFVRGGLGDALAVGAAALVAGVLFAGESIWLVTAVLVAAGLLATLALLRRVPLARGGAPLIGSLLAIAAWNGASALWSIAPDRSWDELNRGLLYAAFALIGAVLGSLGPRALRLTGWALVAALGLAVLWALAGKAIPALFPDGGRAARLRDPIGYWNALALAGDALLVLGLWLAATRAVTRPLRALGAVLAYAAVVAILLAASRTGVIVGVVGVALWLALERERVERALLAIAAVAPAAAVAGWAFTRPALVEDGQPHADRVADGALFALLLVLGAAIVVAAVLAVDRLELGSESRFRLGRALAAGAVVAAVAVVIGVAAVGDPLGDGRSVEQGPRRLAETGLNNRKEFWGEAWQIFRAEPLTGAGAGTFEIARKRYRDDAVSTVEPHSLPLRALAGTGIVGFALLAALMAAVAWAAAAALRRLYGEERRAAAALAVVPAAYLLHALVDYDWSFAAVTGPTLLAAGALATAGRERALATTQPLAAALVAVVTLAALAAVATPWLAERQLREATTELEAGDYDAAIDASERAHALDPLSIEPLHRLAGIHAQRRHARAAREAYAEAVRLQPENPDTWFALGFYEHSRRFLCQAYVHLNESYTLDPSSSRWSPGGPLDEARDFVNAGNCG
jgi:tetratricopeptide (TPR) repeat protein